jgi:nickel/cobalt transporter (NicO) family protein
MAYEFAAFMVLALALGFKHSYDADHLVAVSNLITRSKSLRKTSLMSASWAAGHMLTAAILTILLYTFRETLLTPIEDHLDLAVAVMLVVIGVFGLLWEFNVLHVHEHMHGFMSHRHLHSRRHRHLTDHREHTAMFSIGIVHGLASNDELLALLLVVLGVATLGSILLGVAVFSLGVVAGMILFSVGMNYPILRWGSGQVRRVVNTAVALLSIAYAGLLFAGFEGFNPFPFAI